jgi:hypothetical protein
MEPAGAPVCETGEKADDKKGPPAQPFFSNAISEALHDRSEIGSDGVGPHHFVVLVLDDVAVPGEAAGQVELRLDARDLARKCRHRVLKTGFPRPRRDYCAQRRPSEADAFFVCLTAPAPSVTKVARCGSLRAAGARLRASPGNPARLRPTGLVGVPGRLTVWTGTCRCEVEAPPG